jgi:hypothetical protein
MRRKRAWKRGSERKRSDQTSTLRAGRLAERASKPRPSIFGWDNRKASKGMAEQGSDVVAASSDDHRSQRAS